MIWEGGREAEEQGGGVAIWEDPESSQDPERARIQGEREELELCAPPSLHPSRSRSVSPGSTQG